MTESGRKTSKKPPILPSSPLQINGHDASNLVGGIVEKGFSVSNPPPTSSSAPRPTVLPFPVARHRSHGPHWIPVGGGGGGGGDVEDDEEEDFTGAETIAAFAQPMQRKEKKGLDFTRWRDMMSGADGSGAHKGEKNFHSVESKKPTNASIASRTSGALNKGHVATTNDMQQFTLPLCDKANAEYLDVEQMTSNVFEVVKEQQLDVSYVALDSSQESNRSYDLAPGFGSNQLLNENGAMSLESQIDAENQAQLERMSSDEIAEALAEIKTKMSPALIESFKKRGQDKLKRKKCSALDTAASSEVGKQVESIVINAASALSHNHSSHKVMTADSKDAQRDLGIVDHLKPSPKNGSLWDSWSRRVESVREIRFSLDANVVKCNLAPVARFGSASDRSEYSVSERDFLRTEGDPGAAGYTINEALALTRSTVPGQRAVALHLVAAILDRAIHGIYEKKVGCTLRFAETDEVIDWEAIWAFALGPEPELALSLRMCLDDNHNSVVLACAKVIRSVLSCDLNENFFDTTELPSMQGDLYTAAVFRSKPDMDAGFLHGGFWKYSAKPSNLLPFADEVDDKPEGEHTIQDDIVVAGQDMAAGLIRMGILERIRYLLETQPSASLEECLLSILIAVARHSPTSAAAILKCYRLLQTIVNRFISKEQMEVSLSKIKSVILLKVLAKVDRKICLELIKNGTFQKVTWHLVRYLSLDQWINCGRETCKLFSTLLVEQLRLWKVCITYGHCVSYFADLFPALSIWLNVPSFEKLNEYEVLSEFAAISKEAYLVLEALTKRLPNFYSLPNQTTDLNAEEETWCWSHVGPLIDLALDWTAVKDISPISRLFDRQKGENEYTSLQVSSINSFLWVISSVMHTIYGILEAVIPIDTSELSGGCLPWLPEFVPKIGLKLIKNGYFLSSEADVSDSDRNLADGGSFLSYLCHLRYKFGLETSAASVSCLQGLVQVAISVDRLIRLTKCEKNNLSSHYYNISNDDKILADGLLASSLTDLSALLTTHVKFVLRRPNIQSIETFGRGGPAPGMGVGWGASGGGFWSTTVLLAQVDARLITCLLEVFLNSTVKDVSTTEHLSCFMQMINSALEVCLIAGPRDRSVVDKLFDLLFHVPVLKCFHFGIVQFLHVTQGLKSFEWKYEEEDYQLFCAVLASYFKSRWLSIKTKSKGMEESQYAKRKVLNKSTIPLDTIYEESEGSPYLGKSNATSLTQEWAYQRLPLPTHWFLSPISTMLYKRDASLQKASSRENIEEEQAALLKVAQGGLFFLLGLEATSTFLTPEFYSVVQIVPVVWKLHALSVILIDGMGVLEDQKSRDIYETLQSIYGRVVDNLPLADTRERLASGSLLFQSDVNESYSTFVEMLIEQFAAVSYGDLIFGRQVSVYLHRHVEASVRLATWNALSSARALELLPPMDKCFSKADGYLEPIEDDEKLLEAYLKSWVSGALDKAATRRSASYTLVLHHLSSFIFTNCIGDKLSFRNQLVISLLRDYSRRGQRQGMMMNLVQYKKPASILNPVVEEDCPLEKRLQLLRDACGEKSPLLKEVEKLKLLLNEERSGCRLWHHN